MQQHDRYGTRVLCVDFNGVHEYMIEHAIGFQGTRVRRGAFSSVYVRIYMYIHIHMVTLVLRDVAVQPLPALIALTTSQSAAPSVVVARGSRAASFITVLRVLVAGADLVACMYVVCVYICVHVCLYMYAFVRVIRHNML